MIKVRATLKKRSINRIAAQLNIETGEAMQTLSDAGADWMKKRLGNDYPPASSPGGFPAKRTGSLLDSAGAEVDSGVLAGLSRIFGGKVSVRISASVPYAKHLEYGTRKMAARPFMRPTAAWIRRNARKILTDELDNLT